MKLALLVTLAFLPLWSSLGQETGGRDSSTTVTLTNGTTWRVQVLGVTGDVASLRVFELEGEIDLKRKLSAFTPESQFHIELQAAKPKTFDEHFAMAKKAAEMNLVAQAGAQARKAVECVADTPDGAAKIAELRAWAAGALERMLKEAIAAGELKDAKHYLKLLSTRLADQRSEEQLAALSAVVEGMEQTTADQAQAKRQEKLDAQTRENIDRRLKPINDRVAAADKLRQDAIAKSRQTAQSAKLDERAVEAYKAAGKELRALVEKYPEDAYLAEATDRIRQHLIDNAIAAALHAANMLCVQSDYKGALDWVNKILAFDPDNNEAKQMQQTIQVSAAASSRDWGWGWRR